MEHRFGAGGPARLRGSVFNRQREAGRRKRRLCSELKPSCVSPFLRTTACRSVFGDDGSVLKPFTFKEGEETDSLGGQRANESSFSNQLFRLECLIRFVRGDKCFCIKN